MAIDYLTGALRAMQRTITAVSALPGRKKAGGAGWPVDHDSDKTNDPFVFVHGFFGWGQYERGNDVLAYWGMFTGNLMQKLCNSGFTAVAANIDTVGSAWDRACELYAQLTGTRVDYGKAHSAKFGHPRYGEDYTGRALLPVWNSEHKIHLIGHSFGGTTAGLFASILCYGAQDEIDATTDGTLSDFFRGGRTDWIRSITGLAAAYNGTSLAMNHQAMADLERERVAWFAERFPQAPALLRRGHDVLTRGAFGVLKKMTSGKVAKPDTGLYDMDPDQSVLLNRSIRMLPNVYYFSVPHDATNPSADGTHRVPDHAVCDPFFWPFSHVTGRTMTVTPGGLPLGEPWQHNDGIVNTESETAPFDKPSDRVPLPPSVALAEQGFTTGVYHIFPTYPGAHMALLGNVFRPTDRGLAYLYDLMRMINALEPVTEPLPGKETAHA